MKQSLRNNNIHFTNPPPENTDDYGYRPQRFCKPPPVNNNTKIYNFNPWGENHASPIKYKLNRYSRDLKRARQAPLRNLPLLNNRETHRMRFKNKEERALLESLHGVEE